MSSYSSIAGKHENSWRLAVAAWLVLTPLLLFAGFQQVFSTHADYDDEGYVMLSLVSYMEGKPLYDETYSQYGPFFFMAQSAFHQWTGLPVTHDIVRLKTLGVWLLAATVVMWFVFRQSRSWRLATIGFLAAFFHLDRLCLEPGHPQEFCLLAILAALGLSAELMSQGKCWLRSTLLATLLGLLVGATLMVKLNIGVFLFVSCSLLFLACSFQRTKLKGLFWLGATGAVLLPLLLSWSHIINGSGWALPVVCSSSLLAILATVVRQPLLTPSMPLRACFGFALGVGALVLAICLSALASGTSAAGLWHGLVAQHMGFKDSFFEPAPLHIAAIVGVGLFVVAAFRCGDHRLIGVLRIGVASVLLFCLFQYLPETRVPLSHGLHDRGAAGLALSAVGPALWLLLLPALGAFGSSSGGAPSAGRLPLCLIAALQPMAAYPTPGTQMAVGTLLLLVGGLMLVRDCLQREHDWLPRVALAIPALLVLLCCTLFFRATQGYQRRSGLTSLALPGAQLLKVPDEKARRIRWLVATLREETDTFVFGEHAACSLYFWTKQTPPTGLNPTFWPWLLRDDEQQRVIAALDKARRSAVIHQPFAAPLPKNSPLLDYLHREYRPAHQRDTLQIWMRRQVDQAAAKPTSIGLSSRPRPDKRAADSSSASTLQ